jgi:hypothetical protein
MNCAAHAIVAFVLAAGDRHPVTEADRCWLLRAVAAEGEPQHLVAQTLVNRWAYLIDHGFKAEFPTLAHLVRAYCSPLDPRRLPGHDRYALELQRATSDAERAVIALRGRARVAAQRRTTFEPTTIEAVRRALAEGPIDLPAGVVHFAASSMRPHGTRQVLAVAGTESQNAFYRVGGSTGYRYRLATPPLAPQRLGMLALILPAALLTWRWLR